MTPLRQRMLEDMQLRAFSPRTQEAYVRAVRQLAEHFRKSPELITDEDINRTFAERSFPHALLKKLTDDNDQEALQLAYELLLEGKQ